MKDVVLVTGSAGFIGSHLTERLIKLGYQVIGLDNFDDYYSPDIKWDNIRTAQKAGNFRLEKGDVRDSVLLTRVFADNNIDVVVHLAARAGVRPSLEHPLIYEDVNVGGTVSLLEACRFFKVKQFIFASSSSVYGDSCIVPFNEEANVNRPISPYAASKAAAELFCRTYSYIYNLSVVVLRLFTVYGPRQRPEMAISQFVKMVDQEKQVPIYGNGTTNRDYTYIDDIIDGFEHALTYRQEDFEIFNLGAGRPVALGYLLELIEKALGKKANVRHAALEPSEVPTTHADISKAGAILGYQPQIPIEEGITSFVEWYLRKRG